jgi:VIT1/CCC1 family predicted Fe2+/Mn2+ transporter
VLPYLFGLAGVVAVTLAAVLVGVALLATGVVVGLSGGPPLRRALRQLLIGYGTPRPSPIFWACCSAPVSVSGPVGSR